MSTTKADLQPANVRAREYVTRKGFAKGGELETSFHFPAPFWIGLFRPDPFVIVLTEKSGERVPDAEILYVGAATISRLARVLRDAGWELPGEYL